jgi:hypothetical protein
MDETVPDELARLKALLATYGGDQTSPPILTMQGLLHVSEKLGQQQEALTTLISDFSGDRIARQFRNEAIRAWRLIAPDIRKAAMYARRLSIARDLMLMCCGIAVVILVWFRPIIDVGQVAPQCADPRNLTHQDGGVYCTMRTWIIPPKDRR